MEAAEELRGRIAYLRKRALTLEWDKRHNQLNAGMESKFEEIKKELAELEPKLQSIAIAQDKPESEAKTEPETKKAAETEP